MRIAKIAGVILAVALAAFYGADYLVARNHPLGSVEVQPYYAVPQKDGKTEFIMADPEVDACVQSLLPHLGKPACWQLIKHKSKRIDL